MYQYVRVWYVPGSQPLEQYCTGLFSAGTQRYWYCAGTVYCAKYLYCRVLPTGTLVPVQYQVHSHTGTSTVRLSRFAHSHNNAGVLTEDKQDVA